MTEGAEGPSLRVAVTVEQCWHRVPGGVARAAVEHARAVAAVDGVDQIGVSARHRHRPPPPWDPPIPVAALPLPRRLLYEVWHGPRWCPVERATGPVDVTHATGMAIPPTAAPLVVTVHDLAWRDRPGHFTRHGVRFFTRSHDLTRRHAALVVCPSAATATAAVDAGIAADRVRVVPWGVDDAAAPPAAVAGVRARLGLARPYVLWFGTLEPRKNVGTVVDAFTRLGRPDLDLVLAGLEGWKEQIPAAAAALGERLHLPGFVAEADRAALYAGAEAVCYPSLSEGFGFPVLEAMAQGTPVVTSAGTATEEVLGGGGLAVDPRRPDVVAEALAAVLADRPSFSAAATAQAAAHPWSATAAALVACYREVAG